MKTDVRVTLRALTPTPQGVGVFLSDGLKIIAIFVDPLVAQAIALGAEGVRPPRPLTHDLAMSLLAGFGARLTKVIVHELRGETFYARLCLSQENEAGRHLFEVDARPSDAIALALRQPCPMYVRREVWDQAGDMSWALEQALKNGEGESRNPESPKGEP